jgi:SAM-dependent methyltransferase
MSETIAIYDSLSPEYHRAFGVFLDHTDQKLKAQAWLKNLIDGLASRRVFIDAGAGNGKVTAWFTDRFERTVAIEPNASLRSELEQSCPAAEVVPEKILDARLAEVGDLILCSHVLYYIPGPDWMANLERLASWLSPTGVLVLALQNRDTDCMRMLERFSGRRFELAAAAARFEQEHGASHRVSIETVPSRIEARDPASAHTIAEFMLNLIPLAEPPTRVAVDDYVRRHFQRPDGAFRFSCDQDFVRISRRG